MSGLVSPAARQGSDESYQECAICQNEYGAEDGEVLLCRRSKEYYTPIMRRAVEETSIDDRYIESRTTSFLQLRPNLALLAAKSHPVEVVWFVRYVIDSSICRGLGMAHVVNGKKSKH
jgi:hypothetical protein